MYVSLEKKMGEQSSEMNESRKFRTQMDTVLQAIWSDQDVYDKLDSKIKQMKGVQTPEETQVALNGETPVTQTQQPTVDHEARRALEGQIISEFERKYGLNNLEADKKKEMHVKVGNALADLADPKGNKTYQEVISAISLEKLPSFLENAYFIANKSELVESAKLEGLINRREMDGAAIGSIPSSKGGSSDNVLTPRERETAKSMKIPEDKYLEKKKQILAEQQI